MTEKTRCPSTTLLPRRDDASILHHSLIVCSGKSLLDSKKEWLRSSGFSEWVGKLSSPAARDSVIYLLLSVI